ncbi:hypothetical protein Tco_0889058, partial [Tanacetum coccineum]
FVMSDLEDSTVTYTEVSSPFKDLSDIGSPGVDGLPMMPKDPYAYVVAAFQAPPSSDYVPGPKEPDEAPPLPEFVPEHVYPEFMPPEDEVFLAEEQPLPAAVSPTVDSPGYIVDSDPKKDVEDPEEDPADYPVDGGDDDDDNDESSDDDEDDDDDDVEEDENEDDDDKEEHTAPADSVPPPVHRVTARMSIRDQPPTPFWFEAEIDRLLAIPLPPPSPLSPLSSPLPQIPLPPLPVSSPVPVSPPPLPASLTYPLGYRATMIRLRSESPSTSYPLLSSTPLSGTPPLLPIPLPTPSPPLLLPSTVCLRYGVGESSSVPTARPTRGFRADYRFVSTLDDEIRRDPEREVGYGITNTWNDMAEDMHRTPTVTDVAGLSQRKTDFVTTIRQGIDEIYVKLDDAQDDRSLMSGRLNMLYRDRRAHARTARLMETDARLSQEAWVQSMDASDTARSEVRALRTTVLAQQAEIGALRVVDRIRQAQLTKALTLMRILQTQVTAVWSQQGPASGPA